MVHRNPLAYAGCVLVGCLTFLIGCAPGMPFWTWTYALGAVNGEFNFLGQAVPIEDGLNDPSLTQEQKDKLAFVIKARDYAEQVVGLNVGSSYRTFVNLRDKPLAWNLTASHADAIQAYIWNLPVAGPISYLGFFRRDELIAERDRLNAAGYDTFVYELDAFSTLGLLPDPVSSALLKRSLPSLADTVMHELTHNTVWTGRDAVFSESLATFVGNTASMEFLEHEFGSGSPLIQQTLLEKEDQEIINAFLQEMVVELHELYSQPISSDEKRSRRELIFQANRERFTALVQPTLNDQVRYAGYGNFAYNNAFLLINVRYNSTPKLFAEVYELNNRDWASTLAVFRQATQTTQPYQYLQAYVDAAAEQAR